VTGHKRGDGDLEYRKVDFSKERKNNWGTPVRKSKYDAETHCPRAIELMTTGLNESSCAADFGISRSTFLDWKEAHPEFKEAVAVGRAAREAHYDNTGVQAMNGDLKDFNAVVWKTVSSGFGIREAFEMNSKIKIDFVEGNAELDLEDDEPED